MTKVCFLDPVKKFIGTLSLESQAKIAASISIMQAGNFELIRTKTLQGKIKELVVRNHRIIFFIKDGTIYFVSGFIKKSSKTPKREIDYAQKIYKLLS
ncbi:MAG TPA: type II toxin-antitoxin system RelE/ParE family toxin [Candidatus Paceibacterota bacterium]